MPKEETDDKLTTEEATTGQEALAEIRARQQVSMQDFGNIIGIANIVKLIEQFRESMPLDYFNPSILARFGVRDSAILIGFFIEVYFVIWVETQAKGKDVQYDLKAFTAERNPEQEYPDLMITRTEHGKEYRARIEIKTFLDESLAKAAKFPTIPVSRAKALELVKQKKVNLAIDKTQTLKALTLREMLSDPKYFDTDYLCFMFVKYNQGNFFIDTYRLLRIEDLKHLFEKRFLLSNNRLSKKLGDLVQLGYPFLLSAGLIPKFGKELRKGPAKKKIIPTAKQTAEFQEELANQEVLEFKTAEEKEKKQ